MPIVLCRHTNWPRVFLAGDWTATGWPATMEGAVRSGYLAAEALARAAGAKGSHFFPLTCPPPDSCAVRLQRFFVCVRVFALVSGSEPVPSEVEGTRTRRAKLDCPPHLGTAALTLRKKECAGPAPAHQLVRGNIRQ